MRVQIGVCPARGGVCGVGHGGPDVPWAPPPVPDLCRLGRGHLGVGLADLGRLGLLSVVCHEHRPLRHRDRDLALEDHAAARCRRQHGHDVRLSLPPSFGKVGKREEQIGGLTASAYSGLYSWYLLLAVKAFKNERKPRRQSYASGSISLQDWSAGGGGGGGGGGGSVKGGDKQAEADAEADHAWIA